MNFSPDGKTVVAAGDDGIARASGNVTTGAVVHSYLASGQGAMRNSVFSPDGTKSSRHELDKQKVLIFNKWNSLTGHYSQRPYRH